MECSTNTVAFSESNWESVSVPNGSNLADCLDARNSPLLFGCRTGICGTCAIVVDSSDYKKLIAPTEDELEVLAAVAPGIEYVRLACQINLGADIRVKPYAE